MIILFQNILFLKEFLACNSCFGLFTKIKKGSDTSFWCTFSACFFHKNIPYLILCQWTKFQYHTFFASEDIKQNVLLSFYLGSSWRHKLQRHIGRYIKNGISKNIVHVMKHVNFQLYRAHPDGVIWKKMTIDDKYINKRVWIFTHQTMFVSDIKKKKLLWRYDVHTSGCLITFKKFVHKEN